VRSEDDALEPEQLLLDLGLSLVHVERGARKLAARLICARQRPLVHDRAARGVDEIGAGPYGGEGCVVDQVTGLPRQPAVQ
jgi:hypothetical protein